VPFNILSDPEPTPGIRCITILLTAMSDEANGKMGEWEKFWCGEEHFYICTKNTLLQKCNTLSPWICS